jgi:HEPN domain-containing protein
MRRPEEIRRQLVQKWLDRANEDLKAAGRLLEDETSFVVTVAFHAQQAAEKYLKSFLVEHQVPFPKTHDIGRLLDLIAPVDEELGNRLAEAAMLTDYGVDVRYPGDLPAPSIEEVQHAVELAKTIRTEILQRLGLLP